MKTFEFDATECQSAQDIYSLLLVVLDAPDWHGHNLDALWDSITSDINGVLPPYVIEVKGHEHVPGQVATLLARIQTVFEDARNDENIDVSLRLV